MFSKYFLIFNNMNSKFDLRLSIVKRPNIPSTSKIKTTKQIPGRDGLVYEEEGGYQDIVIPVEFNFIEKNNLKERFRQIKLWINEIQDNKLIFSDDPEWFYKVVDVKLNGDFETILRRKGKFRIDFTCRGYLYNLDADEFIDIHNNDNLYNYYLESLPIIFIKGNGEVKVSINNRKFTVPIQDYIYIDSELELVYRDLDNPFNLGTGKYPNLNKGANLIQFEGNIQEFKMKPRWRCL
ncbi:distal tail protein Dit [Paraclostridium sordellii]|uniref:distal tail protein Dit n=1 Tax=Paraclostridium sordellii TaxID=1505 RepID=UPI0005DE2450|nr:distal tail protein Dit [Paeniclostridium sordellii]CEN86371.1 phage tail component [[Clostridium] sordellii] [Paeniclostridium sordellii]